MTITNQKILETTKLVPPSRMYCAQISKLVAIWFSSNIRLIIYIVKAIQISTITWRPWIELAWEKSLMVLLRDFCQEKKITEWTSLKYVPPQGILFSSSFLDEVRWAPPPCLPSYSRLTERGSRLSPSRSCATHFVTCWWVEVLKYCELTVQFNL